MPTITDFEIVDHGIDHNQYFQGCGTWGSAFAHVVTGCGNNPAEAYDDACEQITSGGSANGTDWEAFDKRVLDDAGLSEMPVRPQVDYTDDDSGYGNECYYYLSIRYNVA